MIPSTHFMHYIIRSLSFLLIFSILKSCGNQRSPTGGPVDETRPEIAYTIPLEFEPIENNEIIIAFTKLMDRTSVINGLVVSPNNVNKRLSWKRGNLHIQFTENLPEDTNVKIFLNQSIRCDRNNTLEEHIIMTFRNGELQRNSISGYIFFEDYDAIANSFVSTAEISQLSETLISLLDQDSLLIFNRNISEENYYFEYLNAGNYTLRAFIDSNKNNRYDFGIDPFFRTNFDLPTTEQININLVVADTVRPNLSNILNPTNNQLVLNFNKPLVEMPFVRIIDDSTNTSINILHQELVDTQLFVVTTQMDTLTYRLQVGGLLDRRGNERQTVTNYFDSQSLSDTTNPSIVESFPRNGSVINSLLPEITFLFNKIMFNANVSISLREIESEQLIPLYSINNAGFTLRYIPQNELREFNSYRLVLHEETSDIVGNEIEEDFVVQFIVIPG
ncbi:MAG: Ig-like domain-containing protein [Candidatus Cloacimonetes bacterium]|nr:Ig-like domain-containing protein [Candidatus Cloacimonadota bacterium]